MESLSDLFAKYGSDKNTYHSYGPIYQSVLAPLLDTVTDVLELGVLGGASLRAWRDFFPNARVVGLDIDPLKTTWGEDRIELAVCDAVDVMQLAAALGNRRFDVVIDDASHWEQEQLKSFELLLWRLRPGGVYIIEDVQCLESWPKFEELGFTVHNLLGERPTHDNVIAVYIKPEV